MLQYLLFAHDFFLSTLEYRISDVPQCHAAPLSAATTRRGRQRMRITFFFRRAVRSHTNAFWMRFLAHTFASLTFFIPP